MRPHDHKANKRARGRADVRARLRRDLGFIGSVPVAGPGLTFRAIAPPGRLGPTRTWTIDGLALSGALRAARTLVREAPAALEQEVGDSKRWLARTERIIEALGPAVREARPLPEPRRLAADLGGPRLARQLAALPPSPLVEALAWLYLGDPDALGEALSFIGPRLSRFGPANDGEPEAIDLALRLVQCALTDGARHADILLELLADRTLATPVSAPVPPAGKEITDLARPARLSERLRELGEAALALDDRRRRAAISLLDALCPRALARAWTAWWDEAGRLLVAADPSDAQSREALQKHLATMPTRLDLERFSWRIRDWLASDPAEIRALTEAVSLLPEQIEGRFPRLSMFFLWSVCRDGAEQATKSLLHRFRRYLRAVDASRRALSPWWAYLDHAQLPSNFLYVRTVEHWLVDERAASRRIEAFFTALEIAAERDEPWEDPALVRVLADLTAELDGARADAFTQSLALAGCIGRVGTPSTECLAAGLELSGRRAGVDETMQRDRFGEIVVRLAEADVHDMAERGDDPLGLSHACRDGAVVGVLAALVTRGEVAPIVELGRRLRALTAARLPLPAIAVPPPRRRAWLRHYPAELRGDLAHLIACDVEAEATAAQLLGKTFPTPTALSAQIEALEKKLAKTRDARLERRIESLKRRPDATPSPAVVAKLRRKLAETVERRRVAAWAALAEAEFASAVAGALGREPPAWVLEGPMIELWPALLSLPAPFRRLSVRLVQERLGPYPWDLRDDRRNRAFLDSLALRGIEPSPWLDGIGVVRYPSPRGDVYLQLERDPIEVLLMGKHFGTCLSPGAMNFFSAVANAADINKRVVYGRDEAGNVVGRCLLALSDEGRILTFHPYRHHDDWAFSDHLADFCRRLAAVMKTAPAERGRVPCLVAPDWYDDGPVDVTGRFAALGRGSPLEAALARIDAGELRALLERELSPGRLDPITLPYVLRLAPIVERADLAEAILAIVEKTRGVDVATSELALERAWLSGAKGAARRFLARRFVAPEALCRPVSCVVLVEIGEASLALRILRRTRLRGIRRWADEVEGFRLYAAARAHEALHRHRLAATLYARAMQGASGILLEACRERVQGPS